MTESIASSLTQLLGIERQKYLEDQAENGGTAEGFRLRIKVQYEKDPLKFAVHVLDALMLATTKKWQEPPRDSGPDLFSIAGVKVPKHLTRRPADWYLGDKSEDDFEKVDSSFATVNDRYEDAQIKMRNAAKAGAAAEEDMRQADEARRRAKGRMDAFLRDLVDA